jgi:hypothetical protein
VLLQAAGDLAGAKRAYQLAIDSGHADAAPAAALNLGSLLAQAGDLDGAKEGLPAGHRLRRRRCSEDGGGQSWPPYGVNTVRLPTGPAWAGRLPDLAICHSSGVRSTPSFRPRS